MKNSQPEGFSNRKLLSPRIEQPKQFKLAKQPSGPAIKAHPLVARMHQQQFGKSTQFGGSINVTGVAKAANSLFAKAPKLQIKKIG